MRRLDELHLQHPFMGARMLRNQLHEQVLVVGRKHVTPLIPTERKCSGWVLRRCIANPAPVMKQAGHEIYPYLPLDMTIARANQVWTLDTTTIPLAKGFAYLTAVVDRASRKVLAAKLAITLEACHAVDALKYAFRRYGVNTGQRSQLTAQGFVKTVRENDCRLSMDGRGAWRDNVFLGRLGGR